jgi:hypothetical protein
MKRNLTTMLLCFCGLSLLQTQGIAQINLVQDYANNNSAVIGTFQGIEFHEGGFSSLYPIPNTNGKEFWTISDRGVNVDAASANLPACRPTYDKLYGFANYAPKIHRIRLNGDSIQILQTITMKRPGGTTATGLLNPTGYGSTALEEVSTDTVKTTCANFASKIAPKDIWGIDSEGLVVDNEGNFWISEEGGPTIWKLNPNGVVVKRFTPYANLAGAQPEDVQIDEVFKYRKNNRGFESLAMAPNGKIYSIIQSPLLYPSTAIGEATQVHRMIEIDPVTNATRVLVYMNDGLVGSAGYKDWKIGDMAAINNNEFLVIEAATKGATDIKKIYKINISAATAITDANYSGTSVEGLVDAAGLSANSIVPVAKTLFLDLKANGWPSTLDKSEGIAIINDSTIVVGNDNDYGQSSPTANGVATATGTKSHILKYSLKGSNKIANYQAVATSLVYGETGPTTASSPYLQPTVSDAKFTSILTAGDVVGGYKMCGTPDGLGAFDNGNGTFTLLMNHEFVPTAGAIRAHGSKGAFVSKWIINKSNLSVVSGEDLIKNVKLWNGTSYDTYNASTPSALTAFGRFCSADLAPVSAFYNSISGKGTQERIYMNGEENSPEGRVLGHIASGANSGTTYELPRLGKLNIENAVASPASGDKTVVAILDDATPGQVYFYIGDKTTTGTEVEKAGLTNGKLYGPAVTGLVTESNASVPAPGTTFTMVDLGNVENLTGATLNTNSNNNGVTTFIRPEDGAWDPSKPNDFYFATTASFSEPSRLWRLRFTDVKDPALGGTIEAVLDGTEGQINLDNIAIDHHGHVLLVEDVGNNAHVGKVFQYTIATDNFKEVGHHDETRFLTGGASFLTQDEEASGIIDVQEILGAGYFLTSDQAHYAVAGEQVEGGQLLAFYNPDTYEASLTVTGPTASQSPYLLPKADGVTFTSILNAGDVVGGYKMAGTPDGLGAFDNNNGTFTVLMNHEFQSTAGVARAHGSTGSFVSKWIVNKADLSIVSGGDLIQNVKLWNGTGYDTYNSSTPSTLARFARFCSADLPAVSAFYNSATGKGTEERIFMNGEENGNEGRMFGHIVTGTEAGTTYELPYLGKFSAENQVASPAPSDMTIIGGMDDSTPGQVYFYVGTKTNTGTDIDKAGLNNGKIYGVTVASYMSESDGTIPAANTAFTLTDLGSVQNTTGATINTNSDNAGVTRFLRPEDGAWDPSNTNDFYFNTTNGIANPSRLWRLRFTDITNPLLGGTITAVLDGTEGQKMLDNMTVDHYGHILLVEDVGNNAHLGRVLQYNIATDVLTVVGEADPDRFLTGGSKFLTQDEEASGILDVQEILGAGMFLVDLQSHNAVAGEQVEGGQFLAMFNPDTYNAAQIVTDIHSSLPESNVNLYPNPTGADATVSIRLEKSERVVINVFDLQGQEVITAIDDTFEQGEQKVVIPTSGLNNGVYIVQVSSGSSITRIRTVVLH